MTTDAPTFENVALAPGAVAGIWGRHLLSLLFPANALAFLWTGPHAWYTAPLFVLPLVAAFLLDTGPTVERRQPAASLPAWPFDALVYGLAGLQLLVIVSLVRLFSQQAFFSLDMLLVFVVVGGSSGFSIITAHELIHRRKPWERALGRLLLCSVLQEHFYTEHLRGHHVRVGTAEDPATARFGESYAAFYRRTLPAQFRSAWLLEARRLGDPEMSLFDPRMLKSRILHGLALGWGIAFAILATCGAAAFAAFLIQAFFASRLLEAVNYFEHWGLRRRRRRVQPPDSWDTHSWFTYYGLTGLSRHADHHLEPGRPFQQLRVFDDVPMLPLGYVGMVDLVMTKNDEFQRLATQELRRRRLGPFAEDAEETAAPASPQAEPGRGGFGARIARAVAPARPLLRRGPPWLVRAALVLGILLALTLGVRLESGGAMGFAGGFALHAWIFAVFALTLRARSALANAGVPESLSWIFASLLLVALGTATGASAAELDWAAANEHSVVELVSVDPDGDVRETKVWLGVLDGSGYVRTDDSRWFRNIERDPDIALRIDGVDHPVRAERISDPAVRERVDAVFREKYGWMVRMMEFFGADGGDNLLRLSPR